MTGGSGLIATVKKTAGSKGCSEVGFERERLEMNESFKNWNIILAFLIQAILNPDIPVASVMHFALNTAAVENRSLQYLHLLWNFISMVQFIKRLCTDGLSALIPVYWSKIVVESSSAL